MSALNFDLSEYRILVLEDALEYQALIKQSLGNSKHHLFVSSVKEAKEIYDLGKFDCLLIDISLSDGTGFDFLQSQDEVDCPVIILSASHEIGNKALGFSLGIQDYIEKPFQNMELAIRVKAKIDFHKVQNSGQQRTRLGNLIFDQAKRKVHLITASSERLLELSRKELDLLSLFIKHPERVFSREQILDQVWGNESYVLERSVDSTVAGLRKKLKEWEFKVSTVYGVGYRLAEKKQQATVETPPSIQEIFNRESEKHLKHLMELISNKDWKNAIQCVHKMKGSFAIFSEELSPLADQIESHEPSDAIYNLLVDYHFKSSQLRQNILSSFVMNAA